MSTYIASSASRSDVSSAYGYCATGDTLVIPAEEATWSSAVAITKPITIQATGATLIGGATLNYGFLTLQNISSTSLMRVTGGTFNLNGTSGGSAIGFQGLSLNQLRIDNNIFYHGTTIMEIVGCRGLIDNNYFYNGNCSIRYSSGTRTQADASWATMSAGTADALFIEANHFIYDASYDTTWNDQVIDTYNGGKLVIRYNVFDTNSLTESFSGQFYLIQTHGNAGAGAAYGYWQAAPTARRGQSVVEIYENVMSGRQLHIMATIRGSANLIYNNTISTLKTDYRPCIIYMYEEEHTAGNGFTPLRTEWPAEDQVHNTFIWGNVFDGSAQTSSNITDDSGWVEENRDYFMHRPATTGEGMTLGKSTFAGSNGGTNTYPTDGDTYPTMGSMSFTEDVENEYYGYVAYTYPHPLRGDIPYRNKMRIF